MTPLVLALLLAAQASDSPIRNTLSNDRPQFPIGLAKDMKLLEGVNQTAIRDPLSVPGFMEQAAKRGELIAIPSGTRANLLSTKKLRGPMFKEIVEVEVHQGAQKGLRGWVCSNALISEKHFAGLEAEGAEKHAAELGIKPLFRDPMPGEKAYLAPQPTMFGMVRTLIRLAAADASVSDVFREWQGASDSSRDAVLKRLEIKKAIFFTTVNTEVKVQKVFPEQLINGIYPVQVELLSGQFKGTVGWVPVTVVSPVPGKTPKPDPAVADKARAERQRTLELRKKRRQGANALAREDSPSASTAKAETTGQQPGIPPQLQIQMQLQMLQQQAALAESQHVNSQMARALRQHALSNSYRNGGGVVYGPNGAMTMDEWLRSQP